MSGNSDTNLARLEQKFDDHIRRFEEVQVALKEWQSNHKEWCANSITDVDMRVKTMEKAFETFDRPARWIGRILLLAATGGLMLIGEKIAQKIIAHLN